MKLCHMIEAVTFAALAASCTAAPAACTEYEHKTLPVSVEYSDSQSISQLTAAAGATGRAAILGLTYVWPIAEVDEAACTITTGYRPIKVFVAHELTKNQCAYDFVFRHEQEHVNIWLTGLQQYTETVLALLAVGATPEAAQMAAVSPIWVANRMHDSPEEYAKNTYVCDGWIGGVVNQYQKGAM
jgi:hypothetical protein